MLQSFVITLREGIEAALAIAIVLSYLKRIGREDLSRSVFLGLWCALGMSIVGAVIFHYAAVNTDAYEGYFMVLGSILVATLVYWMWRSAKGLKGEIEEKLGRIVSTDNPRSAAAVFLFVFLMVGREGVETVLFLSAVSLNTAAILNFIGGVAGLLVAVLFGSLFVRGAIRVNLRQFFAFTTAILMLVAVQLMINGLHELSESHILPSSTREMAIVGPIVNNDAYFFIAILTLSAILFLANRPAAPRPTATGSGAEGGAQRRLQLAEYQRQQRVRTIGGGVALLLAVAIGVQMAREKALSAPPAAQNAAFQGDRILLPLEALRDGNLHFYRVPLQGKTVTFMTARAQPGQFVSAFDACSICEKTFYYQSGNNVVCANCGAAMYIPTIGQEGGCNPVPLHSTMQDAYLAVTRADLLKEVQRF